MSRDGWKRALLVLAAANVVGGIVFIVSEMLVPSFIVYPLFLIAGAVRLVRGSGTTGVVFLTIAALVFILVHLPYTRFGPEGSACEDCNAPVVWATVFALPVLLFLVGGAAWLDLRRGRPAHA